MIQSAKLELVLEYLCCLTRGYLFFGRKTRGYLDIAEKEKKWNVVFKVGWFC